jgi:hypothetical protein
MMDLYKTPMGRKLIERDIPRIAIALERLANLLDPEITDSPLGIGFAQKDHKQRKDGDVINGIYTYKESKDEK